MPWPNVPVTTVGMDQDADTLPRSDILDLANKFNQLIAMRGVADGVCELDANLKIPFNRLSGVEVGSITTPSLPSGQFDCGTITHSLGTDDVDFGGTIHGNGGNFTLRQIPAANLTGTDGRTVHIGTPSVGGGNASVAPASGSIAYCVENGGQTQTVTLRYWIRRRS